MVSLHKPTATVGLLARLGKNALFGGRRGAQESDGTHESDGKRESDSKRESDGAIVEAARP
jgi:hypothetical protein